jgi:autophagy-related protein 9
VHVRAQTGPKHVGEIALLLPTWCIVYPAVKRLLQEMLGVLVSPYVLIVLMPAQADTLIEFVRKITLNVPGLGAVCGYSLFDLKKYGTTHRGCLM